MSTYKPVYLETYKSGALGKKIDKSRAILHHCSLCPKKCGKNRIAGQSGVCKTGKRAYVSSFFPHFGEEAPLVGKHGSGTIFFAYCNLLCQFCQNYDISHEGHGHEVTDRQLADMMLYLQRLGCHNINFVSPSHVVSQILSALDVAIQDGLSIPLVYNTSGYDCVETLQLLEGVMDIYMPDFKFWEPKVAKRFCNASDYARIARLALQEMHRQVGDLELDEMGIANRGVLIRHLVLPNGLAGTREIMTFIAGYISRQSYINIMGQYQPCGRANESKELARPVTISELKEGLHAAEEAGLTRLDR